MINKIGIMQGRFVPREIKNRLQSFPFKNWKKEFYLSKKNGIKLIEWTIDYETFKKNPIINDIKQIKKICIKNEIKIESVTAYFFMQKPSFKNLAKKNKTLEYLQLLFNSCKKLKIKYIVLPLVDQSSINNSNDEKTLVSQLLNFKKLNDFGNLKILFEIDYEPKKIKSFLKKFGKGFGISYDSGDSTALDFNFNHEKKYFNKVYNIHIKDRKKNSASVRLGKGNLKIKILLKYLKKIKFKGNLILQTYIPKNNFVLRETMLNYNFLKKNIKLV